MFAEYEARLLGLKKPASAASCTADFSQERTTCPGCGTEFETAGRTRCPDCGLNFGG